MRNSKIEWTHDTRNLWWGCVEVSPQCDYCYARTWDKRLGGDHWGAHGPRLAIKSVWRGLAQAQAEAAAVGTLRTQFMHSMSDIFERDLPLVNRKGEPLQQTTGDLRNRLFTEVVPQSPNLIFLLLTKRPQNIARMVPPAWLDTPPANVWYGVSAGTGEQDSDQRALDALLAVPGRHFVSAEPLLGPLDLFAYLAAKRIGWVIAGGESGAHARATHPDWLRQIRNDCVLAGVPFFFKQWGEWSDMPAKTTFYQFPDGTTVWRHGKDAAGRTLDGDEWSQFPDWSEAWESTARYL